jgi:putative peptidoglycan lipid II flippase
MKPLHVGGLALALSLSSFFNFAALFFLLERKIGRIEKRSLFQSVLKFAFFSAAMGGIVWLYAGRFDFARLAFVEKLGVLLSAIVIGIVAYLILNLLFNRKDLRRMTNIFSRRRILKD